VKTLLQLAMPMAMAVVVFNLFREERLRRQALWFFAWACVIRAGIQALGIWRTELPRWGGRISALGQEPNNATAILSLGILCLIGLSIRRRDGNLLARTAAIGGMALIAIALVQLSSRGGLIALMAGICALGMSSARAALAAVSLAAILLVGGSQVESVRTRFEDTLRSGDLAGRDLLYPAQLEMFSERPLQGWGLVSNNIELGVRTAVADLSRAQRDSHSLILHVLTSTGVVGAIPLGLSIMSCVLAAWRTRRGPEGALAFALITTVLVLNLSETWIFTKLNWIVFAYAASQPELYQRSADPTETLDAGRQVRDLCTS
jgi:O-antigen ligase